VNIRDPRDEVKVQHSLLDILTIVFTIPDKLEKQPSNFRAEFGIKIPAKYLTVFFQQIEAVSTCCRAI
jgi:hypothetical protein